MNEQQPPKPRSKRIYVYWGIGLILLVLTGVFTWTPTAEKMTRNGFFSVFSVILGLPGETPDDIAARVFEAECEAFPEAINLVAEKGVDFFWK